MQVEPTRSAIAAVTEGAWVSPAADLPSSPLAIDEAVRCKARQDYLNALPIAVAMIGLRGDRLTVLAANEQFDLLDALSGAVPIRQGAVLPPLVGDLDLATPLLMRLNPL